MSDDPLPKLRIFHTRCVRHAHGPTATEAAAMISIAISEITRLRGVVERLQGEHQQIEQTLSGRPLRGSGGLSR